MIAHKNVSRIMVLLATIAVLLAACGKVHIPDVSPADKQTRLEEVGAYLAADGSVNGDAARGKNMYNQMCQDCHGQDGQDENLGDDAAPEYIGDSAHNDPLAFFEIANFGDRERKMPGFYDDLTLEQLVNVLAYAQTLP